MAALTITAAGQSWSAVNGWFVPPVGADWPSLRAAQMSLIITGALLNGTTLALKRRLRAQFNGGTPGAAVTLKIIGSGLIASLGEDGFSDDVDKANAMFEYDLVCLTYGTGDAVTGELI